MVAAVRSPGMAADLQQLQQKHPASAQGTCKLHITTLDVANPASIKAWAGSLRDKCPGLRHVDVVINNAGGEHGPLAVASPMPQRMQQPKGQVVTRPGRHVGGLVRPGFSSNREQHVLQCSAPVRQAAQSHASGFLLMLYWVLCGTPPCVCENVDMMFSLLRCVWAQEGLQQRECR